MTTIVISSGHGKYIRGARGNPVPPQLDEVDEARKVVNRVAELWNKNGVTATVFHDDVSTTQSQNLDRIVNFHNSQGKHDYDISCHFNAYNGSAQGCEILYVTQESLARNVAGRVSAAGSFTNRGPKYRSDLKFLNSTKEKALLLEICFCDNTSDSNKYNANFEAICKAVAESIANITIDGGQPIPPDPPVDPTIPTGQNRLDVTTAGTGNLTVDFNGSPVNVGQGSEENKVLMTLQVEGDVVVTIDGQEFHNQNPTPPPEGPPPNHCNIMASTFGGSSDRNNSAYPPYDYLNDTDLYVALPANVSDSAMRDRGIQCWNRANGKTATGKIRDKGPWMVDDDDYVFGTAEAISITCNKNRTPLPRGPNKGKVPSNAAAIDLSPAMAKALGTTGMNPVDWDFV